MLGEVQAAQGKIVLFIDEIHVVLGQRRLLRMAGSGMHACSAVQSSEPWPQLCFPQHRPFCGRFWFIQVTLLLLRWVR